MHEPDIGNLELHHNPWIDQKITSRIITSKKHHQNSRLNNHDIFESQRHLSQENEELVDDMGRGKLSAT